MGRECAISEERPHHSYKYEGKLPMKRLKTILYVLIAVVVLLITVVLVIADMPPKWVQDNRLKAELKRQEKEQKEDEEYAKPKQVFERDKLAITKYPAGEEEPFDAYRFQMGSVFVDVFAPWSVDEAFLIVGKRNNSRDYWDYKTLAKCQIAAEPLDNRFLDDGERLAIKSASVIADIALSHSTELAQELGENVTGTLKKIAARKISLSYEPGWCESSIKINYRGDSLVRTYDAGKVQDVLNSLDGPVSMTTYKDKVQLTYLIKQEKSFPWAARLWDGQSLSCFISPDSKLPASTALPKSVEDNLHLIGKFFAEADGYFADEDEVADAQNAIDKVLPELAGANWKVNEISDSELANLESLTGTSRFPKPSPNSYWFKKGYALIGGYTISGSSGEDLFLSYVWSYNFDVGNDTSLDLSQLESGVVLCTLTRSIGGLSGLNIVASDVPLTMKIPAEYETWLAVSQKAAKKILSNGVYARFMLPKSCIEALKAIADRKVAIEGFDSKWMQVRESYEFAGSKAFEIIDWDNFGLSSENGSGLNDIDVQIAVGADKLILVVSTDGAAADNVCTGMRLEFSTDLKIYVPAGTDSRKVDPSARWLAWRLKSFLRDDILWTRPWSKQEITRFIDWVDKHKELQADGIADIYHSVLRNELGLPPARSF